MENSRKQLKAENFLTKYIISNEIAHLKRRVAL